MARKHTLRSNLAEITPRQIFSFLGVLILAAALFAAVWLAGRETRLQSSAAVAALRAFPGVEGYGEKSVGGRGGQIIKVTNLSDSGVGSLRACVEASGPRTCVFTTGGTITLSSPLTITNPYITIAGQTAPGGGITLKKASGGELFLVKTHDVIVRYLSVRPGPGGENHGYQIASNGGAVYNVVVDHNSISWGVDSNIETWYRVYDTTISHSLISEGLNCSTHSKGCHSKGLMVCGYKGSESGGVGSSNISILNNVLAHNSDRNPLMQLCGNAQVMNNTTYNAQYTFSHQQLNCPSGASYVNWINNYHKKGPSSESTSDLKIIPEDSGTWYPGYAYLKGNIGPSRTSDSLPDANWVSVKSGGDSATILKTTPADGPSVATTTAQDAYNQLLAERGVGNSAGLTCDGTWVARRDAIDERVLSDVKNGTGKIIDSPADVGGWVTIDPGTSCVDSDNDGYPDAWEMKYFGALGRGSLVNSLDDLDQDGYTDLEEYLNGTDPREGVVLASATPVPSQIASSTPQASPTPTPSTPVAPSPSPSPVASARMPSAVPSVSPLASLASTPAPSASTNPGIVSLRITRPTDGTPMRNNQRVTVVAEVAGGTPLFVDFYRNGRFVKADFHRPYTYTFRTCRSCTTSYALAVKATVDGAKLTDQITLIGSWE